MSRTFRKIVTRKNNSSKSSVGSGDKESFSADGRQSSNRSLASTAASSYMPLDSRNDEGNPNTISSSFHSRSPSNPDVFEMQMELVELRNRIKLLDNGTSKSELLDLLQEKDEELEKKNEQITVLNQKFHQITLGLDQMEQERKNLKQKSKMYEDDSFTLKRHLDNREKEVQTLQARCTSQEEKMKETTLVRASMQKLSKENEALQMSIDTLNKENKQVATLKEDLRQISMQKSNLEKQLKVVTCETAAEIEDLRKTVSDQHKTIQNLERREEQLNNQIEDLQIQHQKMTERRILELQKKHQQQMQALNQSISQREVEHDNERTAITKEKDSILEQLHDATANIARLEDEAKTNGNILLDLKSKLNGLEGASSDKESRIFELNNELSTKTKTIISLRSETEQKKEQVESLSSKVQELMEENSVIEDLETQLKTLLDSLAKLKKQHAEQKEDDRLTIKNLENDLEELKDCYTEAQKSIAEYKNEEKRKAGRDAELELKLNDIENLIISKNRLIAEKDHTISALNERIHNMTDDIRKKAMNIKKLREEHEKANNSLIHKQIDLNEVKEKLASSLKIQKATQKSLMDAQNKLDSSEMQAAQIVNDLEEKLEKAEQKLAVCERESLQAKEDTNRMARGIQEQLMGSLNEKEQLEKKMKAKFEQMQSDTDRLDRNYLLALAEKEKDIQTLEKKLVHKETTVSTLCNQLDKYKNERKEKDEIARDLQLRIEDMKAKHQEELMEYRAEMKLMQSNASRKQEQEIANGQKFQETKAELDQRTKLLGDLVSHNKELDNDLLEARSVVSELQEELNNFVKEKNHADELRDAAFKELNDVRGELTRRLEEEQDRCRELEVQLENALETIDKTKTQSKELTKKEAEISTLKNKISRQEAYLQRLLQKQKDSRRGAKLSGGSGGSGGSTLSLAETFSY